MLTSKELWNLSRWNNEWGRFGCTIDFFYFFNEFKLKNIHCTIRDNTLIDHIKYFFVFLLQIDWFTLIFRDSILTWFGKGRKTIYVFDFRPLHVRSTRDECTSHVCKEFKRGTISVSLFKCVCVCLCVWKWVYERVRISTKDRIWKASVWVCKQDQFFETPLVMVSRQPKSGAVIRL
jgi:hypothetical protein